MIGEVLLLEFRLGYASNTEAFLPSPQQFTYFWDGGFDLILMSFLQISTGGSVNVSHLSARPHITTGYGGFIGITSYVKCIIFSGFFSTGAQLQLEEGQLRIIREGKARKLVQDTVYVTLFGKRAIRLRQQVQYITERCVLELAPGGLLVMRVAPGTDPERDILTRSSALLRLVDDLRLMNPHYF